MKTGSGLKRRALFKWLFAAKVPPAALPTRLIFWKSRAKGPSTLVTEPLKLTGWQEQALLDYVKAKKAFMLSAAEKSRKETPV